jgi:hypothetical protein
MILIETVNGALVSVLTVRTMVGLADGSQRHATDDDWDSQPVVLLPKKNRLATDIALRAVHIRAALPDSAAAQWRFRPSCRVPRPPDLSPDYLASVAVLPYLQCRGQCRALGTKTASPASTRTAVRRVAI